MKKITDKGFVYVPSDRTDVKATFKRIRDEIAAYAENERREAEARLKGVIQIKRSAK